MPAPDHEPTASSAASTSPGAAGTLHVVATPIGNLSDLSPRALDTLRAVAAICAEDTRHTRQLLAHFGIERPLVALHDHNEDEMAGRLVARLLDEIGRASCRGRVCQYVSISVVDISLTKKQHQ